MNPVRRLIREPLLHFLIAGAAIFVIFAIVADNPTEPPAQQIVITPGKVVRLTSQFRETWRRPPTDSELDGMIEDSIREEVYVREALALGLDADDTVIRRRLRQKMEFLSESGAGLPEPSDDVLRAHLNDNAERFTRGATVAFEQVFLGDTVGEDDVGHLLAALNQGEPSSTMGRASLLPGAIPPSPARTVDGRFGSGFFEAVMGLEPGGWEGPIASTYGQHLVRVTGKSGPELPSLDMAREQVAQDWRWQQAEELAERRYQSLRSRYEVVRRDRGETEASE